ncbi:MAG: MFS transporter [Rhodopirellula sp.]|nr:MFS transporter [Rhodopirellula sp.]
MTEDTPPVQPTVDHRKYKWELLGLLCLAFFFHQGDRAIFGVVATEIQADLHLGKTEIGLVGAILFWTIAVMTPIAGYLGDMLRKKAMVTGALLFWSSTTALTGLSSGFVSLAMLRSVATGGSESFYAPPAYALLARFHHRTRALAMSVHQAALYIGVMTSGLIGGFVAKQWGWRSVFYVYGGAGVLIGLVFVFRLKDERDFVERGDESQPAARPKWENPLWSLSLIFRTPTALLLATGFTAVVFVNNAYVVFAPAFLEEKFGLSEMYAGTYAMFFHHVAALVGVLIGGPLSDALARKVVGGRLRIQTITMFLGAMAIVFMSRGASVWAACAGMAVFGLFRGLYESNTHASLFEVVEPKYRSSAVGAMVMMAFLLGAVAPWLMGFLCDRGFSMSSVFAGYSLAYVIGGLSVGLGLLVFFKRDRIIEEPTL